MKDKEFKKIFKEEFEKENECKVSINQVLPNIDTNNLSNEYFKKYKKQQRMTKYFALNSLVVAIILFITITGFSIKLQDHKEKLSKYPVLSEKAEEFMLEYCGGVNFSLLSCEKISESNFICIYQGIVINNDGEYNTIVFYFTNYKRNDLILKCNEREVELENLSYGIIEKLNESAELEIIIETENYKRKLIIYV